VHNTMHRGSAKCWRTKSKKTKNFH